MAQHDDQHEIWILMAFLFLFGVFLATGIFGINPSNLSRALLKTIR
jgi:hypothetical protein